MRSCFRNDVFFYGRVDFKLAFMTTKSQREMGFDRVYEKMDKDQYCANKKKGVKQSSK